MFIYYCTPIEPGPFPEVGRGLVEVLYELPHVADVAYGKGEELARSS